MGKSGYTSLSINEKQYTRLRKNFDSMINTEKTFTVWAMNIMEAAVFREKRIKAMFPELQYIGNTSNKVIIQDKKKIMEITVSKNKMTCNKDKGNCKHILFTILHPSFEL